MGYRGSPEDIAERVALIEETLRRASQATAESMQSGSDVGHWHDGTGTGSTQLGQGGVASGNYATQVGDYGSATADWAVVIGAADVPNTEVAPSVAADAGIAIGYAATVTALGFSSIAMGDNTYANEESAVALGSGASVEGFSAIAIGNSADVSVGADYAISVGYAALASTDYAIAIGRSASSSGLRSIAVGHTPAATADYAIAIGYTSSVSGISAVGLGEDADALADYAIAIGSGSDATVAHSIAIGKLAAATAQSAIAIGPEGSSFVLPGATATAQYAIAIGSVSEAHGDFSMAIGEAALATITATSSIAFGHGAGTSNLRSVALGYSSATTANDQIMLGNASHQVHIPGTLKIPTGASSGYVWTSDAAGVGSWQSVGSGSGAAAFVQGGNSFGATAVLGTNDAFNLEFETSGTTRVVLNTSGQMTLSGASAALSVGASVPLVADQINAPRTFAIYNGATQLWQILRSGANSDLHFSTTAVVPFKINRSGAVADTLVLDSGEVGIGTATPLFKTHIVETGVTGEASAVFTGGLEARTLMVQGAGAAYIAGRDVTSNSEFAMGISGAAGNPSFVGAMTSNNFHLRTGNTTRASLDTLGNVVINTAALATTATDGFLYITTTAGTPTGVPTSYTGRAPINWDSTNNLFYVYEGGWNTVGGGSGWTDDGTVVRLTTVSDEVVIGATTATNAFLHHEITGPDGGPLEVGLSSWRNLAADTTRLNLIGGRGTNAAPTLLPSSSHVIGEINFLGQYDSTRGNYGAGAKIDAQVANAFSPTQYPANLRFFTTATGSTTLTERMSISDLGNVVIGTGALATTATDGFLYITTTAGTPTGVPTSYTGRAPINWDSTNNVFYVYESGWNAVGGGGGWTDDGGTVRLTTATDVVMIGSNTSDFGERFGVTRDDTNTVFISAFTANAGINDSLTFHRGRGTKASPTATLSGDYLGGLYFDGQPNTTVGNSGVGAAIEGIASANWSGTSYPTRLAFSTTAASATTATQAMMIASDQRVLFGTPSTLYNANYTVELTRNSASIVSYAITDFSATAAHTPAVMFGRGRGTNASPSAVQSGDVLGTIYFQGQFDTTRGNINQSVRIEALATGTFSGTNAQGQLSIYTTPSASTTPAERFEILDTGQVSLGIVGGLAPDSGIVLTVRGGSSQAALARFKHPSNANLGMNVGFTGATANDTEFWNWENGFFRIATNNAERMRVSALGSVVVGTAALATTATDGFLYIPTCAGTPTGTPTAFTGRVAMIFDTTNNKFWIYDGGWIGVVLA